MPVSIKGSGGGSVTLDAGAAAADTTLTLPNTSGTILQSGTAVTVAQGGTGAATLTANGVLIGNGTSAVTAVSPTTAGNVLFTADGSTWSATQKIVAGTAVASTSGTSIDFTSIPSWVKRITVIFNGVSTNGTSPVQIQIGGGTVETSGYNANSLVVTGSNTCGVAAWTTGFVLIGSVATDSRVGTCVLTLLTGNTWVASINTFGSSTSVGCVQGAKAISSTLDRVRITTVGGTDTFDAGTINLLWE